MSSLERIRRLIGLGDTGSGVVARLLPARARAGVARMFAIVSLLAGCSQVEPGDWVVDGVVRAGASPGLDCYQAQGEGCALLPDGVELGHGAPVRELPIAGGAVQVLRRVGAASQCVVATRACQP